MPRPLLDLVKRSYCRYYCPGGGPSISFPCRAAMAAICCISASSGGASAWGGMVSSLAGSPISSLIFPRILTLGSLVSGNECYRQ